MKSNKIPIEKLLKRYQIKFNRSLSLRNQLDMFNVGSIKYNKVHQEMLNAEIECQELDEVIYYRLKTLIYETEYTNHLKTTTK